MSLGAVRLCFDSTYAGGVVSKTLQVHVNRDIVLCAQHAWESALSSGRSFSLCKVNRAHPNQKVAGRLAKRGAGISEIHLPRSGHSYRWAGPQTPWPLPGLRSCHDLFLDAS